MNSSFAKSQNFDPLKKPVNTLAIVAQNRKITVLGRKTYNVMLSIAQGQGIEKQAYRAPLSEIVSGIDYSSNDSELIKKHLRAMASTVVEWNSPTTGEGSSWTVCTLISHANLAKKGGQVWVEWAYAQPLKQELLEPSVFTRLSLEMLSQMHTHAGIALYEICARYKSIGRTSRQSWRWWLPVLTGLPTSDSGKLEKAEYRFFKRDSIKPAIAEVNTITDIDVELVEYKNGKSISDVQFLVRMKAPVSLPLKKNPPRPVDLLLIKQAVELGIGDAKAEELVEHFGEAAVRDGLQLLLSRVNTSFPEPVRDPFRYLKSILLGDQVKHAAESLMPQPPAQKLQHEKKKIEIKATWNDEWVRRQRAKVTEMLLDQSDETIDELTAALIDSMRQANAHPSLIKRLQTSGWSHPLVKHLMLDFYARAALGENWDKASSEDLLEIASDIQPSEQ
ncbi:MAG: replication initiation protein [Pseudomonadota bacterium]|nr:replication initiation protein [Pseudomonadota bacterium]